MRDSASVTCLSDEVLSLIIQRLSFRDKCSLQFVCRAFNRLLSCPTLGETQLWGMCDVLAAFGASCTHGSTSRWLNKGLLGFSMIKCDATCKRKGVRGKSGIISLIPKLCGNFAPGTKLCLGLTPVPGRCVCDCALVVC
ncbi:hypothetical protein CVIRNUC_010326 [Coccomyxa viridis]|uniref:F-box domain-containing protein n=1 Tax=Coccomyxa viridis TaxID=1274662 RepID=A0AAV1ILJ5_9CHLO|nr:hypothetical protein CVIRNUC_010326 [Coccomyxa viridis]